MPRQAGSTTGADSSDVESGGRGGGPAQGRELRARGRRTMQKLLDAGATVFARKGYHAARVDDIVKVAKTSHGTFYLYFSNKEDLFAALVGEVADRLETLTESLEPIGPDEEGMATLRTWIAEFCALYSSHGSVIRTWTEAESDDSEAGQIAADVLTTIASSFAAHIEGAPDDIDTEVAAMALVAMVERFNYFGATGQIGTNSDEVVDTLAELAHGALFGSRTN